MKNLKKISVFLMLLLISVNATSEPSMSDVVYAELGNVDVKSNTLVVAGNTYSYKLDVDNSSYKSDQDIATSLTLRQLKPGNMYYFEMIYKGRNKRNTRFSDIIFISESAPSE